MHKVLLIDLSIYKNSLLKTFTESGYDVVVSESAFDAMAKLKTYDFDLVVSEVELPGDNAFDLYNYIHQNYPYIPTIMTTEKNIDNLFEKIFQEGIGNVLCKPINKDELLNLAEKIITKKNIFGLHNYMENITATKKIRITSSKQINKAIRALIKEIKNWGFAMESDMTLSLVLNEMTINAIYHSHGYTKEKEARVPVQLPEGHYVDIFFCRNQFGYGIAIDDYNGKLSKDKILNSINSVIEQNNLIEKAAETGEDISAFISDTGRGIDLVRKLAMEYYFIVHKDVRTEIILVFNNDFSDDSIHYSSLKIIEDRG
ncbi:MAG: response regulator [bacterium]|nr:response regulator [bacterium]